MSSVSSIRRLFVPTCTITVSSLPLFSISGTICSILPPGLHTHLYSVNLCAICQQSRSSLAHAHTHTRARAHTHTYLPTHTYTHTYTHTHTYIHLHTHTHLHPHLHTYTHTHTHILFPSLFLQLLCLNACVYVSMSLPCLHRDAYNACLIP